MIFAFDGDGAEELLGQLRVEPGDRGVRQIGLEQAQGPTRDVDRAHRQRLVHRHGGVAVAADPGAVAERLVERLAEGDPDVLDRVVRAGLEVALGLRPMSARRPWRPSSSSMWSKKPTPVETATSPPSSPSSRLILVSRVSRSIFAVLGCRSSQLVLGARQRRLAVDREAPRPRRSQPRAAPIVAPAAASMATIELRRMNAPGPSGAPKRAAPPVGSTWLEPAA